MSIKLGVVMDPIETINPLKDTTLALLLAAQQRSWRISYMTTLDLALKNNVPIAKTNSISVNNSPLEWYILGDSKIEPLSNFDVILMRKDPPFNMHYITATYILELAEKNNTLVVNKPQSLRDANEKLFTSYFPECTAPSIVTCKQNDILKFLEEHESIVIKPLNNMGGNEIFKLTKNDLNTKSCIELLTHQETTYIMAQRYIDEIENGDKRIIMINGEPVPYALARIPAKGDFRGNLAKGAQAKGQELSERDYWICQRVGPTLVEKGLYLVGLDIIGGYLTEINVTSPTCVREIENNFNIDICGQVLDCIEHLLPK